MAKKQKSKKAKKQKSSSNYGKILLIAGLGNSGKSHSLKWLRNAKHGVYANSDLKELPVQDVFGTSSYVENPKKLLKYLKYLRKKGKCKLFVLDTLTHLMRDYVRLYVDTASNTQAGWGENLRYYSALIRELKLASFDSILMAHLIDVKDDDEIVGSKIPVAGSPGKAGVETEFTNIVHAMSIKVKTLKKYPTNKLLTITKKEAKEGIKHVFLTRKLKRFPYSKARMKEGVFKDNEVFIDNNAQIVLDRLHKAK